jgi:hypothetical protein
MERNGGGLLVFVPRGRQLERRQAGPLAGQAGAQRIAQHPVVLCLQDTTELDFNGQHNRALPEGGKLWPRWTRPGITVSDTS